MAPSVAEAAIVPASNTDKASQHKQKSNLEIISQGAPLPGIPLFSSTEKHRHWLLEHMSLAFRVFARKGYTEGMSGHISIRDPEHPHNFWTNPLGRHFALLRPQDMILLDYDGKPVGGNTSRPANAAGFLIHSAVHRARPDVNAACHTHSPNGVAWSAFARPLDMLNQDICYLYGDAQAVYRDFGGVVLDEAEGKRLAAALGPKGKAMVLRNHGLLTVGGTVDEAAYLFTLMEKSCGVQLATEAAAAGGRGAPTFVEHEAAQYTFDMASDPESLYCEFQPDAEFEREMARDLHLWPKGPEC